MAGTRPLGHDMVCKQFSVAFEEWATQAYGNTRTATNPGLRTPSGITEHGVRAEVIIVEYRVESDSRSKEKKLSPTRAIAVMLSWTYR